ncbi:MAG TPA: RsmE family RNA methyltransferase [Verrucomicrobiae bacterium]|nr:RsmE family RNA methyltransferase [Verrucomicrobiae bacterium]
MPEADTLHRFYVQNVELKHDFWLHDQDLLERWHAAEIKAGEQVILFDGQQHERLYRIEKLEKTEARLLYVTDFERRLPKRQVYLLWSLRDSKRNDELLRKATALGVSHFVPLLVGGAEKVDFSHQEAMKSVRREAEASGRSDVPTVREPMRVATALDQLGDKVELYMYKPEQSEGTPQKLASRCGVLIAPEGGWSDAEKQLFAQKNLRHLMVSENALSPEAAGLALARKLLQ